MRELTAAVYRQRDEDSDVEPDFKLKNESDLMRANQKYRDDREFSKLVVSWLQNLVLFFYPRIDDMF